MLRSTSRLQTLLAGLLLLSASANAQTVYGLFGLSSPAGNKQMGTLDPSNGDIALLGSGTSIDMNAIATTTGATAVAVDARRMYFIGRETGVDYVYTVSLDDGMLVTKLALTASMTTPPISTLTTSNTMGVWYDEPNAVLYALFIAPGGDREVLSIDPTTGEANLLSGAVGGEAIATASGVFTGDSAGERVFFIGTPDSDDAQLYIVSTNDGSVSPVPFQDYTENDVQGIEWDSSNDTMWAIVHGRDGERMLAIIDIDGGEVLADYDPLDDGAPISTSSGLIALEQATQRLFFIGNPDGAPSISVYTVDLSDGSGSYQELDNSSVNPGAIAGIEVVPGPDLSLTKDDGGASVVPGDTISYTLTASNAVGAGDSTTTEIVETVPANTTFNAGASTAGWSCADASAAGTSCTLSLPNLASGDSNVSTFVVDVLTSVSAGTTQISNSATLQAFNALESAMASDTTPVTSAATLTLAKSDGDVTAVPGDTVTYTLTVANTGNQDSANLVLHETVPANSSFNNAASTAGWICTPDASSGSSCDFSIGTLAGGTQTMVDFAVDVDSPLAVGVTGLSNAATSTADNAATANASDTTPITAAPTLSVSMDDGGITAVPGQVIVYSVGYQNSGDQNADATGLSITMPAQTTFFAAASDGGWSCLPDGNPGAACTLSVGLLAGNGGNGSVDFAVTLDSPVDAGTTQIDVSAAISASNASSANGVDSTPVTAAPALNLYKGDGDISSVPGASVSYALVAMNDGNMNADGSVLTETVPANSTFDAGNSSPDWICVPDGNPGATCTADLATLAGGDFAVRLFAVAVDNPVPAGTTQISNSAELDASNAPSAAMASDDTPLSVSVDLSISKADGGITVVPGQTFNYTLGYANDGTQNTLGTTISETVPDNTRFNAALSTAGWSCADGSPAGTPCTLDLAELAAGASGSATFSVDVANPVADGITELSNSASISDSGFGGVDANDSDNSASVDTPLDTVVDLHIEKMDGGITAFAGQPLSYTLSFVNNGNQNTLDTTISETVPDNSTFNAALSTTGWSCADGSPAATSCTLDLGELPAGAGGAAIFTVDVVALLPDVVTDISNTASIADAGFSGADANSTDNSASIDTPVLTPLLDLAISKVGVLDVVAGVADYEIIVTNQGNVGDSGSLLSDALYDPTFNRDAAAWTCVPSGGASCPSGGSGPLLLALDLPAGSSVTVILSVPLLPDADIEQIFNTATITASTAENDAVPGNNSATASVGRCLFCDGFETPL